MKALQKMRKLSLTFIKFYLIYLLAVMHSIWDLSSQIGDRTHTPCTGSAEF